MAAEHTAATQTWINIGNVSFYIHKVFGCIFLLITNKFKQLLAKYIHR